MSDGTRMAPRGQLAETPAGDLLQAGPLLVHYGRSVIDGTDREGFSAGAGQPDSDVTVGRYPRCALVRSIRESRARVRCRRAEVGIAPRYPTRQLNGYRRGQPI